MGMSRRTPRGGPVPAAGVRPSDGTRVVTPAQSRSAMERARAAATPSRPARGQLLAERLNADFFREAWLELKKVQWPSRRQARNLALLVVGTSILVGVILGGLDYVFEKIFEFILQVR